MWSHDPGLYTHAHELHNFVFMRNHIIARRDLRWRPYRVERTGSLPTSEVKRRRARLVLGWGTAREDLRVLLAFCSFASCVVATWQCCVFSASALISLRAAVRNLMAQGSKLRKAANCARQPTAQGSELRKAANCAKRRTAQSSELRKAANCAKQRTTRSSELREAANCAKQRTTRSSELREAANCAMQRRPFFDHAGPANFDR